MLTDPTITTSCSWQVYIHMYWSQWRPRLKWALYRINVIRGVYSNILFFVRFLGWICCHLIGVKDVFGSFLCASYCAAVYMTPNRECGFDSHRRLNYLLFISLNKIKMQFNSGLNAKINIAMDFWSKHWWKNSKSMDFGDFKQSFCISGFLYEHILNIELKLVQWHILYLLFQINNKYIFSRKKNINFLSNSKFVKMYTIAQYFYTYTKLTDTVCLVFCYNFRTWKVTLWTCLNKVKIVGKGGCVQNHFSKKRARWPIVVISLLNSALQFLHV